MLELKNITICVSEKEIIKNISMQVKPGQVHAIMGPNGSGKTTLAMGLMGHPNYKLTSFLNGKAGNAQSAEFTVDAKNLITASPEERAKAGLFVSFQNPVEIAGVSFLAFLRTAAKSLRPNENIPLSQFKLDVRKAFSAVSLDENFLQRSVNESFSGGERKRAEVVQLLVLQPKYAILDEIDSGLDIDSLRIVAEKLQSIIKERKMGAIIITHYPRIFHYLRPDSIHILIDGAIRQSGDMSLVEKIEKEGYASI